MLFALSLSVVVVAYNNLINRWAHFHGSAYVPVNLLFGCGVAFAATTFGVSLADLVGHSEAPDTLVPLIIVAIYAIGASTLARSRHAHRIADRRVAGLRGRPLAYQVLFRIPLGTAVVEEVIFRGAIFAVWRHAGESLIAAAVWASIAFGLWHITPTILGLRTNYPGAPASRVSAAVAGAVALTTVAGLGLTWMRVESEGLLAPVVLHGGINSVSALAAMKAGRGRVDAHQSPHGSP
jgi:membrane protease YdiL (CAAX protease family)